ncbi:MAG: hypothetical protein M1829_006089 [Trizodia sp. TS-e1964]|nr:MAG: hypothetical protein M1829_006089 [Trizodia sp. TS-e1964]
MPSSPRTPTHSRTPSHADVSFHSPSPYNDGHSPTIFSHSRSGSINSPGAHNLSFSHGGRNGSISISSDLAAVSSSHDNNGLGSLADELADAWDEEEEEGESGSVFEGTSQLQEGADNNRDSGIDVSSSPAIPPSKLPILVPPTGRPRRKSVSEYDGSDYGDDSDLELSESAPGLEARLSLVESLARYGTGDKGSDGEEVIQRVANELKSLSGQAGVENGATRLVTAHIAISTHLGRQSRAIQTLCYPLLSPLSPPPDPDLIDELIPLISNAVKIIPQPTSSALASLSQLSSSTADLVMTLSYLSDSLHMSRQTTTIAARKLKSARDLVTEIRRDSEEMEEGKLWIERGDWQNKLRNRECGGVCRDVVGGFEEVCAGWREKLAASAEVGAG